MRARRSCGKMRRPKKWWSSQTSQRTTSARREVLLLAREYKGVPQWDAVDHTAWFYIYRDQMREWFFYTDTRTFEDRYKLAQERGVEGFCSWVLGSEDPGIWDLLPDRK